MRLQLIAVLTIVSICHAARLDSTYLPPGSAGSAGGSGLIRPPGRNGGLDRHGNIGSHGGPSSHGGPGSYSGPTNHGGPGSHGRPGSHGGQGGYGEPGGFGFGGGGGDAYSSGGSRQGGPGGQEIPIISYSSENIGDGNYEFSYETGNGIMVQETGHQQGESESVSGSFSYTGPDGMQYSLTYTADEHGFHPQGAHLPTPPPIPPEIQRGVELALAAEARGENQDGGYSQEGNSYSSGGGSHGGHGGHGGHGSHGAQGGSAYQGPNSYQTSSGGGYRY